MMLNIFSYLHINNNSRLDLDSTHPEIDHASFKNHKWVDFYVNVQEEITLNMPEPRGEDIDLRMYGGIYHD